MLEIAKQIDPPSWMQADSAQAVMAALNDGGTEGVNGGNAEPLALFVGGCVRNQLLQRPVADVDIATVHEPEEVMALLARAHIKAIPTGLAHGTVTAVCQGQSYEITTLRRDVETDGRRAVVAFTRDWREDAQRRDFTMNTLLATPDGTIYDPAGRGLSDLEAGAVIFVGDPATRIAEDYLRILRFFRFHALYGRGAPDKAALSACRAAAGQVRTLSRERITSEFLKILSVDNAVDILALMFKNNILIPLSDHNYQPEQMKRLISLQKLYAAPEVIARLAVLGDYKENYIKAVAEYLLLTSQQKAFYDQLLAGGEMLRDLLEKSIKRLRYKYKKTVSIQCALIFGARDPAFEKDIERAIKIIESWTPPVLPVGGDDIRAAGIAPGPRIGEILSEIERWWIEGGFAASREECLSYRDRVIAR